MRLKSFSPGFALGCTIYEVQILHDGSWKRWYRTVNQFDAQLSVIAFESDPEHVGIPTRIVKYVNL